MRQHVAFSLAFLGLSACKKDQQPPPVPPPPPEVICQEPVQPVDTSSPTTVVGDGSAASCTETALRQAASTGGIVTFNCGAAPVVIPVISQIDLTADVVIDGNNLVTLDG